MVEEDEDEQQERDHHGDASHQNALGDGALPESAKNSM